MSDLRTPDELVVNARRLDMKGRCCGRKPIAYKRDPHLFCPRCSRAYDPHTGNQINNWAYTAVDSEQFRLTHAHMLESAKQ